MFESLSDRLQSVFQKLGGKGKLNEDDVREGMKQVRLALLEADVNFKVVKDFVAKVTEQAIGEEVTKSLTPAQQVVKIVHQELIELLGSANALFKMVASGKVKIRVNQKYKLADVVQAHRDLEGRKTTGSTVIIP